MLSIWFISLIFGCFSGLLAGLLGLGGGIILVPFFIALFEYQHIDPSLIMLMAVATSLATVLITASMASYTHYKLDAIIWRYVLNLSYGIIIGVFIGSWIAKNIQPQQLRLSFALYLFYTALKLLRPTHTHTAHHVLTNLILRFSGVGIGIIATLMGIGGGSITVPLLLKHHLPSHQAVAISSACGLPIALLSTISYTLLGWQAINLPVGSVGYIYLPAFLGVIMSSFIFTPIGARLANRLPTQTLKQTVAGLLLFVSLNLINPLFL